MKRRGLWIALAVLLTLVCLGGTTFLRASDLDRSAYRRAIIVSERCAAERGAEYVRPPEGGPDPCYAPERAYYNDKSPYWMAGLKLGAVVTAGLWVLFLLLFFGIRHLRGGRDAPEAEA
jgi:hypothetical protein